MNKRKPKKIAQNKTSYSFEFLIYNKDLFDWRCKEIHFKNLFIMIKKTNRFFTQYSKYCIMIKAIFDIINPRHLQGLIFSSKILFILNFSLVEGIYPLKQ